MPFESSEYLRDRSEIEPRLAGGVGQGLDAAVVQEAVAVEHDALDLALETHLGDQRADLLGRLGLGVRLERALQVTRQRRRGRERAALGVVHDLRVDVTGAAEDAEPRALLRAGDLVADAGATPLSTFELCHLTSS